MQKRLFFPFFVLGLLSCCAPQTTVYQDITGQGRSNEQLKIDAANCSMYSSSIPATTGGYCPDCAVINAMTTRINRQNAFSNCMLSRGWQAQQ